MKHRFPLKSTSPKITHLHPLYFQKTFLRVLPVFFLPLLQILLQGGSPSPYLLGGSCVLVLYFTLLWQQSRWIDTADSYWTCSGLFLRRMTALPKKWALHIQREVSPISLLTGAVFFHPGIPSPSSERFPLFHRHAPRPPRPKKSNYRRASIPKALLSAALLSNPASGLLLATVFFRSVSSLLGTEIARRIVDAADQRVQLIALGIPPAIAGISWLFLAGWAIAFLREALALLPFQWKREGDRLFFKMGVWPRRESSISISSLGSAVLLQTLPMALLGIFRAEGFLEGGGRVILHPSLGKKETPALHWFFPQEKNPDLCPHSKAWFSFLWLPVLVFGLLFLLEERMLPFLNFLMPVFPLLFLPALWFFAIRLLGYFLTEVSFRNGLVYLRGIRIFTLYSGRIDPAHITGVQFLQNPIQRFTGRCTLVFQTTGGRSAQYRLYHIPLARARQWVSEQLGISSEI